MTTDRQDRRSRAGAAVAAVPDVEPLIATTSLTKRYAMTTALDGVSMRIAPGITGLLGANGAGKTTLLKLILGLLRPEDGTLEVLGLDPWRAGPQVRAQVGYAPENDPLPEDVRAHDLVRHMAEVHGIPRRLATGRASDSLHLVGLGEERFRPLGTMSVGQRQRVKLAQAIAHDPELVLLDEPTNGLDPVQRDEMLRLIKEVGHGMGLNVILASHILGEVERVCDGVVILDGGRLVRSGSLRELQQVGNELLVEVDGSPTSLVRALTKAGLKAKASGREIVVALKGDATFDRVRDALATTGVPLRRLRRRTSSLEDVFFTSGHAEDAGEQ